MIRNILQNAFSVAFFRNLPYLTPIYILDVVSKVDKQTHIIIDIARDSDIGNDKGRLHFNA